MTRVSNGWRWGALALVLAAVAVLVRAPTSLAPGLVWTDPNTPLHALSARELVTGGGLTQLVSIGVPEGMSVRLLALPLLLLGALLNLIFDTIAAFNLAVVLWVWLCGLSAAWVAGRIGGDRLVAGVGIMVAPLSVQALGNGQYENLVTPAFVLGLLAATRASPLLAAIAAAMAGFSSPYQGGTVVLSVVLLALVIHRRQAWRVIAAGTVGVGLAAAYYLAVLGSGLDSTAGPAPDTLHQSASLSELVLGPLAASDGSAPVPGAGPGGAQSLTSPGERTWTLIHPADTVILGLSYPWKTPHTLAYLGLPLLVLGLLGWWRERRQALARGLVIVGAVGLLLGLGSSLKVSPGIDLGLPLPWALSEGLPGVGRLQVTTRMLTGLVFALVLGAAWWARGRALWLRLVLVVVLVADGLWWAPVHWPAPALRAQLAAVWDEIPDDAIVASWPGPPKQMQRNHFLLATLTERPLAWFLSNEAIIDHRDADPRGGGVVIEHRAEVDRLGRDPQTWLEESGVDVVVEAIRAPDPIRDRNTSLQAGTCADGVCLWWMPR